MDLGILSGERENALSIDRSCIIEDCGGTIFEVGYCCCAGICCPSDFTSKLCATHFSSVCLDSSLPEKDVFVLVNTELVEILTGLKDASSGTISMNRVQIIKKGPRAFREVRIAHIPEDRLLNGLAKSISIEENLIIDRYYLEPFTKNGRGYY